MPDLMTAPSPIANTATATSMIDSRGYWDYTGNPADPEWIPDNAPDYLPDGKPNDYHLTPEQIEKVYGNKSDTSKDWSSEGFLNKMIDIANTGNEGAIQWVANYFATKESEKSARDWTASREDTAYQRLNEDLKKAGISPYILSGATPSVSSATGKSFSGSSLVSSANNQRTNSTSAQNNANTTVLRLIGVIASALLMSLLA